MTCYTYFKIAYCLLPIGFIEHQGLDLRDSCENEWLCSQIAAEFGFSVAPAEIFYFEDVKALAVDRFDRKLSERKDYLIRLPQEDCCQALGYSPNLKYQSDGGPGIKDIMSLLLGSALPDLNRQRFFRSQILFWLLAAIDGHAKNFSIFLERDGRFYLTPLYDVMSAYPLITNGSLQKQKIKMAMAMAMALRGKRNHYRWNEIQRRHFASTAKNANYLAMEAERLLEEMLSQVEKVIDKVSKRLASGFPMSVAEPIFNGMRLLAKKADY